MFQSRLLDGEVFGGHACMDIPMTEWVDFFVLNNLTRKFFLILMIIFFINDNKVKITRP